ncbi:MAG: MFS transporter [Chloroflexi bacterium]|nr:MFS transporter [Chloroflexota bacterium]
MRRRAAAKHDRLMAALVPLGAAAVAFMAAQGFGRFGFGLVLPAMRDALGLTNGEMGTLAGVGLVAYLISSAPAGALATRYGTRWVVVSGLLGIAAGLAGTGFATGFVLAAGCQALAGITAPAAVVPLLAVGNRWAPPALQGRATGLVVAGGGLGLLAAGVLVPWLLGPNDALAWRRAWWGLGGATLAAAIVAALFLRDPPRRTPPGPRSMTRVQPESPAVVRTASAPDARPDERIGSREPPGHSQREGSRTGIGLVYRSGGVWRLAVVYALYGVAYIVYGTFFAAHLQQRGLGAAEVGRLWALAGLAAAASGLVGGLLADRLGPTTALVTMFLLEGGGLTTLALGDGTAWYALSALLYGISMFGFPAAVSKACSALVGPRLASAALGLLATTFAVGQAAGPIVAGVLADYTGSLGPGLLFAAASDAFGALVLLVLREAPLQHADRPRSSAGRRRTSRQSTGRPGPSVPKAPDRDRETG